MIRAVIFDFNGVLVDDEHLHFELFRDVLAEEGILLTEAKYHADYLGYDDRGCFGAALADAGRAVDAAALADLIDRKAALYARAAETSLRIFPHAGECVAALADRWPVAICSGALRPEIEFAVRRIGAEGRVDPIVSAEDTSACKPDPEGYLLTLDKLRARVPGLSASECVVIEDSLAGLAAAKSAGMWAVGVTHTYPEAELLRAGADAVLPGLAPFRPDWIVERFDSAGPAVS